MKMLLLPPPAIGFNMVEGWCRGCNVGLEPVFDAAMAGNLVLWWTFRDAFGWRTGSEGFAGRVFVNKGAAALEIFLDAISQIDSSVQRCLVYYFGEGKLVNSRNLFVIAIALKLQ